METNNNIVKTLQLIRKYSIFILVVSLVMGIGTYIGTKKFVAPQYRATTELVGRNDQQDKTDVNTANLQLLMANTYKGLTKSSIILTDVKNKLTKTAQEHFSVEQLQSMITVDKEENSQIFSIHVIYTDPGVAEKIAKALSETLTEKVDDLLGSAAHLSIISPATVSYNIVSPNYKLNAVLGFLLGMIISAVMVYFRELQNNTLDDYEMLSVELGLKNLGNIANITKYTEKKSTSSRNRLDIIQKEENDNEKTTFRRSDLY